MKIETHKHARGLVLATAVLIVPGLGAGPPEVVRVRVPAAKVDAFFPAGVALRGMSVAEFDALVESARTGFERRAAREPARLLRARHSARWEAGALLGRSELVVASARSGPDEVELSPWTPALERTEAGPPPLLVRDSGTLVLEVGSQGPTIVVVNWQLRARAGSEGLGFTLGLPALDAASLVLDLPAHLVPDGPSGARQGPAPGPSADRRTWRFDGRGGLIDLRLRAAATVGDARTGAPIWVSGPTVVDLQVAAPRPNWRVDWMVGPDPRGPRRFVAELDAGLELIDVTGPAVAEYQAETRPSGTEVTIKLSDDAAGPTPVTIQAWARAPFDGPWTIPAARPVGALWMGGATTVRLDPNRVLKECRERAGRRLSPRLGETTPAHQLVFEARAPRSVAELVFRDPWTDAAVEVRGHLVLGSAAVRLRGQLKWTIPHGALLGLDVDLPPAWVPDPDLQVEGSNEPLVWHPEVLPGGGVRLHIDPPTIARSRKSLILNLSATATTAGGRGPLALPRIRPVGARVADELWLAWTEPGLTVRPTVARGLAWIDPALVTGSFGGGAVPPGYHESLAWRWTAGDAEGRIDRDRVEATPTGEVLLTATVGPDRLRLEARITVNADDEPLRSLPIALSAPTPDAGPWTFTEETTGLDLVARPLDARQRDAAGLPATGPAWELALSRPRRGPVVVRARLETSWNGQGEVPLPLLSDQVPWRGTARIEADRVLRSSVRTVGLRTLARDVAGPSPSGRRRAQAFAYGGPGGRLELRTETLKPIATGGVIDEAVLTTYAHPSGAFRQRLTLRLVAGGASTIDLSMPPGAALARVLRDGRAITPVRTGRGLTIALPEPRAPRSPVRTIVLEYATTAPASVSFGTRATLRPSLPTTSLPCLSFCWEVVTPEPWAVVASGPGLRAADPTAPAAGLAGLVADGRDAWARLGALPASPRAGALPRGLDERVAAIAPEELALGEWFTRWDADALPLVLDRLALASAGWGPGSRIVPPRLDPARPGAALQALQPLGLTAVALGGALLVTTRAEAPDRPGGPLDPRATQSRLAWETTLRQATAWSADASDRFQSVARWRGESTPDVAVRDQGATPEAGWKVGRFVASGWPDDSSATVQIVDARARAALGWTGGLVVLALGVACRNVSRPRRALGLVLVLLGGVGAWAATAPRITAVPTGVVAGALAVLFFWWGRALGQPPAVRARPGGATLRTRASSGVVLVTATISLATVAGWAAAQPNPDGRVLALLPFDGPPDPARAPNRVVLRWEDYERLQTLAESARTGGPAGGIGASSVHHRVSWQEDRVVVASEFTLAGAADPGAAWEFPIGNALDVTAELDGVAVPVLVRAGGRTAAVAVTGTGRRTLRVRRSVIPQRDASGATLNLPVNPAASARVTVEGPPAGGRTEVVGARGAIAPVGAGVAGGLGPVDALTVRWPAHDPPRPVAPTAVVEGILLWDAEPAGDRVRARLTYHNSEGIPTIRLGLAPGLVVRSSAIPGRVDTSWQGPADQPEWVASIEPPLPDGTTIELECWRPASYASETSERSFPRIEPLKVKRSSGLLAFRRPPDWSGRLTPAPGSEPITEEAFVKAWGALPDDPLTLSGALRFVGAPSSAFPAGPVPRHIVAQTEVALQVGAGRIEMQVKANLTEESGRIDQAELAVPAGLSIIAVEADGLNDWARPAPDRLRLEFDGLPAARRTVRIQGWLAVGSDPLASGPAFREVETPWARVLDVEEQPAKLLVNAPMPIERNEAAGAVPIASERPPAGTFAAAFRVDRPEALGPGRLRWQVEPPRVSVQVQSQLTIGPGAAEWVAVVRYDVSGGPLDVVHLKLPTAWASEARVRVLGDGRRLTAESRGATTFWTVRPEHPFWGSQRLIVRSRLPMPPGATLNFPELAPLGRGTADAVLALVNATGRELTTRADGLHPLDDASKFHDEAFAGAASASATTFRVSQEGWSLTVQAPGATRPDGDREAALAEATCTLAADGSALGMVRFEVEPGPGPFLPVVVPSACGGLLVTVNNVPVQPLRSATDQWLIPLDDPSACAVVLVWRRDRANRGALPLPLSDQGRPPQFVTVWAPPTVEVATTGAALFAIPLDRLEIEDAEGRGRRISARLGGIDRAELLAELIDWELRLRTAERAVVGNLTGVPATRDERVRRVRDRARVARAALESALKAHGLDAIAKTARIHLGLEAEDAEAPVGALPEPVPTLRIHGLGRPLAWQRATTGPGPDPAAAPLLITRDAFSAPALFGPEGTGMPIAAGLATCALALSVGVRMTPTSPLGVLVLLLSLAALAILGGPWALAAGLALIGLGRLMRVS